MAAVAYEKKDHVAVVTLKNAGKRHWSEPEWIAEVQAAGKQAERDLDVYVLLFTDAGACSKEMAAPDKQNNAEQSRQLEELCAAVRSLRVPVIAAMNGFSLDGSCDLVKACDICMASETVEETGPANQVVAPEALTDTAMALAVQICANGQIAVQEIKRCVNMGLAAGESAGLEFEQQAFALCNATEDKRIGMGAYLRHESEKKFQYR